MRIATLLGVAVLGLWPCVSQAQQLSSSTFTLKTTRDLYNVCSVGTNDAMYNMTASFCQGFLMAVVNYDYAVADRKHLKEFVCEPPTATVEQGVQAFVTWAAANANNEKYMNEPPVYGAVRGLAHQWPCPK